VAAELPAANELDAVLHGLGMGALILILGMGVLLLPEFARTPLRSRPATLLGIALLVSLNLAAALRVGSALGSDTVDAAWVGAAQAAAGVLTEAALLAFCVALILERRRGAGA
jgi:hypothetical protein